MNKHILLAVSTLALAFGSTACLMEPLSPEEEAAWLAETASYNGNDQPAAAEQAEDSEASQDDQAAEPSDWDDKNANDDAVDSDWYATAETVKPDPTPWVETGTPNGKPDPTPWRTMAYEQGKPDPTPWRPVRIGTNTARTDQLYLVEEGDGKPDPTPWKSLH